MKLIISILSAIALTVLTASAQDAKFQNETLDYKVMYKWGLISKQAGTARLVLTTGPKLYKASLYAQSASWAKSFYELRDTLHTTMSASTLQPLKYTYISHENGRYAHDEVKFSRSGNKVTGTCTHEVRTKKGNWKYSNTTLTSTGPTVDMLSLFFYIRTIDFPRMRIGTSQTMTIFSGRKKETLTLTYKGRQRLDMNGKSFITYYITFTFTTNGKKSSDPMSAWITADSRRIPLQVEGELPVGKIRCQWTGK